MEMTANLVYRAPYQARHSLLGLRSNSILNFLKHLVSKCALGLALVSFFTLTAHAQPTVVINEYPVTLGLIESVSTIAAGPDAALWVGVETLTPGIPKGNDVLNIWRTTTAGVTTQFTLPPASITVPEITAGADGALWFTFYNVNTGAGSSIGRITTSGTFTAHPLPTANAEPQGITNGPDGALWFTESGKVGRITTSGTSIIEYPLPTTGATPQGITTGPDGALWFTEPGSGKIGRITTGGVIAEYVVPGGPGQLIAAGSDGALWFTVGASIGRITTAGAVTEYPLPAGVTSGGIAAGPDGALWFTAGASIGRITTAGAITEYPLPDGTVIGGITAGADGAIWFGATRTLPGASVPSLVLDQAVINPSGVPPVLSITKTHAGTFTLGEANAAYTITVSNQNGAGPTVGGVTVTDTLPSGLSFVSIAGAGWNCGGYSCTRIDALAGGASYPPITVTVNVAANASSPQVNQAMVTGGESASASASDSTTIINPNPPLLSITKTHTGSFSLGQVNAAYTVSVSNQSGAGPTVGAVTVTDTLPSGLSLLSMAGSGWSCTGNSCTRSDALAAGASYPSITVTVNVAAKASSPQVNLASVSGGGNASTVGIADSTTISAFLAGAVTLSKGVEYLQFPNGDLFGYFAFTGPSWIYHFDMGYEYLLDAYDGSGGAYLYDWSTGHWFFTSAAFFPYLYDFTLQAWIYYVPDPANPGHYTTTPRQFAYTSNHQIFTM